VTDSFSCQRFIRLGVALIVGFVSLLVGPVAMPAVSAESSDSSNLTVMTQNLYLGADVSAALALMPDIAAAAQFMWDSVRDTDFPSRAPALAAEAAAINPVVIGLQEATTWSCTPDASTAPVVVFDFTADYLAATAKNGPGYVVATKDGAKALSPGYAIEPIVGATVVRDPARFQPLFGTDQASCGFQIADALLVRADMAEHVAAVGIGTFDDVLEVIPGFITVERGYAWADLDFNATPVRFVTTHLESVWSPNVEPNSVRQARQLLKITSEVTGPIVVMGDFNADPRDPRGPNDPNPAKQPEASAACQGRTCNAYWIMVDGGFTDAGPDTADPKNFTWGADPTLAGPDLSRVPAAIASGNSVGYTERLDYVFVRGEVTIVSSNVVGNSWPTGISTWSCGADAQVSNSAKAAVALGVSAPDQAVCFGSDHAAVVVVAQLGALASGSSNSPVWFVVAGVFIVVIVAAIVWGFMRRSSSSPPIESK
jgi:hypothetical protein